MTYPFESNPLEDYLLKKRKLLFREQELYGQLYGVEVGTILHRELRQKLNTVQAEIISLKNGLNLKPRDFDVFYSDAEIKVANFENDYPQPLSAISCEHKKSELRIRTYSNRSTHVVSQCLECGCPFLGHKKENVVGWQSLPKFDEKIEEELNDRISKWHSDRSNVYLKALGYDEVPQFNYDEFVSNYRKSHPEPLHPATCKHEETCLTIRYYSNGSNAVVNQCIKCGKHLNNVAKKNITNPSLLVDFDEEKQVKVESECSQHSHLMHEAMMSEIKRFKVIREEYLKSVPPIPNRSRFSTYYKSGEWKRTRQRIFERDNKKCQSCGEDADCVHHILYDRFGAENDIDLISVCNTCHTEIHSRQDLFSIQFRLTPIEISTLNDWTFVEEKRT